MASWMLWNPTVIRASRLGALSLSAKSQSTERGMSSLLWDPGIAVKEREAVSLHIAV